MHTEPPDIDPDSKALQYRIEDVDGTWVLVREYPKMPRTPDETVALAYLQELLVTDGDGHWLVHEAARPHLDAEPGDVVSIIAVGNAQTQVVIDAMGTIADGFAEAVAPALEALNEVAEELHHSMLQSVRDGLASAAAADDEDSGESALPEPIREARERREQQRESERSATDWYDRE